VAADAALPRRRRAVDRHVADGRLRVRLDLRLAVGRTAPGRDDESGASLQNRLEGVVIVGAMGMLVAELPRAGEERLLNGLEQILDAVGEAVHRDAELL